MFYIKCEIVVERIGNINLIKFPQKVIVYNKLGEVLSKFRSQ